MQIFLAIVLGLFFGFVLQKAGAANPQKIIGMLRLKDFHLMKAILLGIGTSSLILFILLSLGIANSGHLDVKSAYIGVIIGGALLGTGWALAGFCPGTGVVAAGAGRRDAMFFVIGGLIGAFILTLIYGSIKDTFIFNKIAGGEASLAATGIEKYTTLIPAIPPALVAGGIAVIFIVIAILLPSPKES